MELRPGARVSSYVVETPVGVGSYGAVWSGHHVTTGARVAIKALLKGSLRDEETRKRFRREGYFLSQIQSPYVGRLLEFVEEEGAGTLLVMEFIEGKPLAAVLSERNFTVEEAIELGIDLASGVRDLHAKRIIHRDLKPANIMLRPVPGSRHRATIIDFGLSRLGKQAPGGEDLGDGPGAFDPERSVLTQGNMAMGSLPFMAPEQILDARQAGPPADLYAIAAILYFAITGTVLFGGNDQEHARSKLTTETPDISFGLGTPLGEAFERFLARALRRRPSERFTTADDMLQSLADLRDYALSFTHDAEPDTRRQPPRMPSVAPPGADFGAQWLEMGSMPTEPGRVRARESHAQPTTTPPAAPERSRTMLFVAVAVLLALAFVGGLVLGSVLLPRRGASSTAPS